MKERERDLLALIAPKYTLTQLGETVHTKSKELIGQCGIHTLCLSLDEVSTTRWVNGGGRLEAG